MILQICLHPRVALCLDSQNLLFRLAQPSLNAAREQRRNLPVSCLAPGFAALAARHNTCTGAGRISPFVRILSGSPQRAAAVVATVATLVAAVMISAVQKTPAPSAARISAAIKSLRNLALDGTSHSRISWTRAGLSPADHSPGENMGFGFALQPRLCSNTRHILADARHWHVPTPTRREILAHLTHFVPAQELHEMLARQDTMNRFNMLQQKDVKRAMACPIGKSTCCTHNCVLCVQHTTNAR